MDSKCNPSNLPYVSFIICSYNQKELLRKCLWSIINQNYPIDKREIIIVDGGSTDGTLAMLDEYFQCFKVIDNPKRLPEGRGNGKWLGYNNISDKAEYVVFIDQDNEIQGQNWIRDMLEPLSHPNVFGAHCRLLLKPEDPIINRYVAILGTDPFAAYRSIDGQIGFRGMEEFYEFDIDNMFITGGNCFMYKRSALDSVGGYIQDTDNVQALAEKGGWILAIPKKPRTWHHAANSIWGFIKKKAKWGKNPTSRRFKWIPTSFRGKMDLAYNIFCNLTVVLNIVIALWGYFRDGEEDAWLLHPPLAFVTTWIYGLNFIKGKIFKE